MLLAVLLALCSPENANAARRALTAFHVPDEPSPVLWPRFKKLADKHGRCTGGVLGEYWDDTVTAMFDKQWKGALHFPPLRKNARFRAFVGGWSGATADQFAVRRVLKRANHCALEDEELCGWIRANFSR